MKDWKDVGIGVVGVPAVDNNIHKRAKRLSGAETFRRGF